MRTRDPRRGGAQGGGRPVQRAEEWGTWASRTWKCGEAGGGRPQSGGAWAAKTVKRPRTISVSFGLWLAMNALMPVVRPL